MVYELNHDNPVVYVIPVKSILGKLPLVPVGDTGTIPFKNRRFGSWFPGGSADRSEGSGDGSRLWYVNTYALGWSREK